MKVLESVPISSIEHPTPEEVALLEDTVASTCASAGLSEELVRALRAADAAYLRTFFEEFDSGGPSFMFVREPEWRRVLAYWPEAAMETVLMNQRVGRRYVLLIANQMGAERVRQSGGPGSLGREGHLR